MVSTIAVGVDGSPRAAKAVDMAVELARPLHAKVVLLSALPDATATPTDLAVDTVELEWATNPSARVQHTLDRTRARVERDGLECSTLTDEGEPADVLVRLAGECSADILVVGNKGMKRRVLSSVPNRVTHKAECAVLIVHTG